MSKRFDQFIINKRLSDDDYMRIALQAASAAKAQGNAPIGAVLVWPGGKMVEGDTTYTERDPTCTAGMNVMKKVAQTARKQLTDAILYVTVDPDLLTLAAAEKLGIREVVYGAYDVLYGCFTSKNSPKLIESFVSRGGILGSECCDLLPTNLQEHTIGILP